MVGSRGAKYDGIRCAQSREQAQRWLWSTGCPMSAAANSSELMVGGCLALRGSGCIDSVSKVIAFYLIGDLIQLTPICSKLPLSAFGAGWYKYGYDVCAPRITVISKHLAGVNAGVLTCSCGVTHCQYPYFTYPQAAFSPREVRNMTAACPACSTRSKGLLEMRLTTVLMACARVMGHGCACPSDGELLCVHKQWRTALLAGIFCTREHFGVAGRSMYSHWMQEENQHAYSHPGVCSSE